MKYGYVPNLPDPKDPTGPETIPNPLSKTDFIKEHLLNRIREVEIELEAKKKLNEQYGG
jgi:hypothetical protein